MAQDTPLRTQAAIQMPLSPGWRCGAGACTATQRVVRPSLGSDRRGACGTGLLLHHLCMCVRVSVYGAHPQYTNEMALVGQDTSSSIYLFRTGEGL